MYYVYEIIFVNCFHIHINLVLVFCQPKSVRQKSKYLQKLRSSGMVGKFLSWKGSPLLTIDF